jgi:tripartite-type tricarboxylate transporter receptor subunit TctC
MKHSRRQILHLAAGAAALPALSRFAQAQTYPMRPVRIVVPFAPGPGPDVVARIIANRLSELWKTQVIIENKPGAGGNIGAETVARSAPDGYTLLAHGAGLAVSRHLYERLSYDAVRDLAPVALTTMLPNVIIVPNSSPIRSVAEFIDLSRTRGHLTFASPGVGTTQHLSGELLKSMAGINLTHVPYRGTPPALTDVVAGRVDSAFMTSTGVSEAIIAGQVKGVAVTSAKRYPLLPDLPSVSDTVPGYDTSTWYAFFAPAKTPTEIVRQIHSDILSALTDVSLKQRLEQVGVVVTPSSPDELAALLAHEIDKWGKVIRAANIKAE